MGRTIIGTAIVFNELSQDLGGFREIIKPESCNNLLGTCDILDLLNHNEDKGVLARYTHGKGSLQLSINKQGLHYSFEAPQTSLGEELLIGVQRGDIRSSSFSFIVGEGQIWEELPDGSFLRTITKFDDLRDISQVYRPAYIAATVTSQ